MNGGNKGFLRCYAPKKFNAAAEEMLANANAIIAEYEPRGISITLRQLYYQFVARDLFTNVQENYDKLQDVINDGRMAGRVSWTAIQDLQRVLRGVETMESPLDGIKTLRDKFRLDKWRTQPMRPEVWVEKDALLSVVGPAAAALQVDYFSCRGYTSQSTAWRAGRRFQQYVVKGQVPIVFHLGDHDPSGIDMTRDIGERLALFCGVPVQVVRLALNMEQVERYGCPPNPAKITDPRAKNYIAKFGDTSWELDALPPDTLVELIGDAVGRVRDESLWSAELEREAEMWDSLDLVIEEWEE